MPSVCARFKNASWSGGRGTEHCSSSLPRRADGRGDAAAAAKAPIAPSNGANALQRTKPQQYKKMKKGLSQILLLAAALRTTTAFTPTRSAAVAGVALNKAAGFEVVAHGLVALMANPTKRADHLASTDDPIDECVAVLANGEEPDEDMLAKCQDIAREEFASQATLEDENSY